jgi:hypothetical protein
MATFYGRSVNHIRVPLLFVASRLSIDHRLSTTVLLAWRSMSR